MQEATNDGNEETPEKGELSMLMTEVRKRSLGLQFNTDAKNGEK